MQNYTFGTAKTSATYLGLGYYCQHLGSIAPLAGNVVVRPCYRGRTSNGTPQQCNSVLNL